MGQVIVGLLLAVLGMCGVVVWWPTFGLVMRGTVPFVLMVLGLLAILSGFRTSARTSSEAGGANHGAKAGPVPGTAASRERGE